MGGFVTSYNAFVGQEPMQDKQPTQFSSITTTGLLLCFLPSGLKFKGSKASNGQWVMHMSQPVHWSCTIATMA